MRDSKEVRMFSIVIILFGSLFCLQAVLATPPPPRLTTTPSPPPDFPELSDYDSKALEEWEVRNDLRD